MLTVHHLGKSQSERIVWLCEELAIPYELKCYARVPATKLAPAEYKALHPSQAAPVITDLSTLTAVGQFTLTPDCVKAYSGPHNPIHFDPDVATRHGYRAPIMGGTQCVRFVTAAIWRRFKPRTLDMDIYFRRPLFWDDTFSVMVDEHNGQWKAICLAKEGKVATEARINSISV